MDLEKDRRCLLSERGLSWAGGGGGGGGVTRCIYTE